MIGGRGSVVGGWGNKVGVGRFVVDVVEDRGLGGKDVLVLGMGKGIVEERGGRR